MTGNIGSNFLEKPSTVGFMSSEYEDANTREKIDSELMNFFRPELINRIDEIVVIGGMWYRWPVPTTHASGANGMRSEVAAAVMSGRGAGRDVRMNMNTRSPFSLKGSVQFMVDVAQVELYPEWPNTELNTV